MAKKLADCRQIFLDSTVISDLLNYPKIEKANPETQERLKTVKVLIDSLSRTKSSTGERIFSISTISISEVYATTEGDYKSIYDSVQMVIGSNNVEVVSYGRRTSILHNDVFREKVSNSIIAEVIKSAGYSESKYVRVNELVRKDYLIIATAMSRNPDVVFTGDHGFSSLANKMGLNSVLTLKKNFQWNAGEDKIYEFY